jgi:hypothetical protein
VVTESRGSLRPDLPSQVNWGDPSPVAHLRSTQAPVLLCSSLIKKKSFNLSNLWGVHFCSCGEGPLVKPSRPGSACIHKYDWAPWVPCPALPCPLSHVASNLSPVLGDTQSLSTMVAFYQLITK